MMAVLLLAVHEGHEPLMAKWLNDPEVVRWTRHVPGEATEESEWQYMKDCWRRGDNVLVIIYDGKPVGTICLFAPVEGVSNVSIMIGERAYWGKGIATEAIRQIADYAFRFTSIQELWAGAVAGNVGSWCAFVKAGFHELPTRTILIQKGVTHEVVHVRLTKQDWQKRGAGE